MTRLIMLLILTGCSSSESVPGRTLPPAAPTQQPEPNPPAAANTAAQPEAQTPATGAATQRADANPTVRRALEVIDSLIKTPLPGRADRSALAEQNTWFKSLRDRLQNLLALVVAPAKVEAPAPIEPKHLTALQEEAEKESQQQPVASAALKARQDLAMNAIRNMK